MCSRDDDCFVDKIIFSFLIVCVRALGGEGYAHRALEGEIKKGKETKVKLYYKVIHFSSNLTFVSAKFSHFRVY